MRISVPYYRGTLEAEVEDSLLNGVYESHLPAPQDEAACVAAAMDTPIGSPRLEELARGKRNVVVITSDHTRPVPSRIIMPQILKRLRAGQPDIDITILVATGFPRPTTHEELVRKLGEEIVASERIVLHDSSDEANLVEAGTLPSGGRLIINRLVMEAELVVAEGFIEPHFFAGFSGGRKSILPGVVSRETVFANHCAEFIASPFARTGIQENNPIHRDMLFAAQTARLAFIVNVIIDSQKRIVHAVTGDFRKAHESGCEWLKGYCHITVPESDIVITSNGGYPLDQNLYQAVKGMTAGEAACREGGCIILAASCCDGCGGDSFYKNLSECASPAELTRRILAVPRNRTEADQWQFQILARIMEHHTVIVVTTHFSHDMIRAMHLTPASTLDEALAIARGIVGAQARIAVIPDGVSVICSRTL
ncbi:MAG: nickel-dependent lactate racemase [Victivallales bacterium]|nr:nickel-dependent lactate racemase [Victivallales bacterium]